MTYTTFRYANPKSERSGEVVTVSVTVTNEGDRDGVETVLVSECVCLSE